MRSKIVLQGIKGDILYIYDVKGCPQKFRFKSGMCWVPFVYRGDGTVYFSSKSKKSCGFRSTLSDGSNLITIMLRGWSK